MNGNLEEKIWWYSNDGKHKEGPVSYNDLKKLYLNEEISAVTEVWRNGLSEWRLLSEIPELAAIIASTPPPIHSIRDTHKLSNLNESDSNDTVRPNLNQDTKSYLTESLAQRPWIRFWAKLFDIVIGATIIYFVIGIIEVAFNIVIIN